MSTTIDQRIVEMRFDNKQFERNVSTTMSSLDKLKQKLKLDGVSKGLEDVNAAAGKVDMSTLGNSVEKVGLKFSGLWTIADQALRNITNSAMNAGKRIVSALTIDPIKTGFSEYETQINAIQTILANTESKGTTLTDVNEALDELNAYADKTIYNFTEMTRNIGTFTAAGVDLDTSVSAIKGIANLAAVSGSTSQQASTAMYQLSQALASGTVKLMDWNSVVNAGMGGQVFQDALKETARVHGIAIDDLIKQEGSFRETLSHGWLSSEILTETLSKFTGDLNAEQLKTMGYTEDQIEGILKMGQTANDAATKVKTFSQLFDTLKEAAQSGWTSTWEIIVGDFEEAKALLTKVSDTIGGIIGESAEARNDLLQNWKVLGGRTELIEAVKYAFEAVMTVVQAVSEAMNEVFPPLTSEKLVAFCKGLKELAQRFAEVFKVNGKTTKTFNNLKRTLKGVFAIVDIVRQVFVALVKAVGKVLGVTGKVGEGLLYFTAVIGDWLVAISDALEYSGILEFAIGGIGKILEFVIGIFTDFGRTVSESFLFKAASEGLNAFIGLIHGTKDSTDVLAQAAENIKTAWTSTGLYKFLISVWDIIKGIGSGIKNTFGGLADAFKRGDFGTIVDFLNGILSGGFIVAMTVFIKKIKDLFEFGGIFESINDLLDKVGNAFQGFANKLNAEAIKEIAIAIALLAGSLIILALLDEDSLSKALAGLTLVMAMLAVMMKLITHGDNLNAKVSKTGGFELSGDSPGSTIMKMGIGLLAIGTALRTVASLDWGGIGRGLVGIGGVLAILSGTLILLQKFGGNSETMKSATKALRSMAFTLVLIAIPLSIIGDMGWTSIEDALIAVAAVLGMMTVVMIAFSHLAKGYKKIMQGATSMVIMAAALNLLVPPLLVFALLPEDNLIKACIALVAVLASLAGVQIMYTQLAKGNKKMLQGAAAIAIIAASISLLMPVLLTFAALPFEVTMKAIGSLVVVLAALAGVQVMYTRLATSAAKMIQGAAAIAIITASVSLLLPLLLILGNLDFPKLLQSIITFGVLLAALAGTLAVVTKIAGKTEKSAARMMVAANAMVVLSAALLLLTPALLILGSMSVEQAITSIIVLAAAIGVLVGAGYLLKPVIGTLALFGGVVAKIGIAILAAGAGIILFGIGLSTVATGIIAMVGAITACYGSLGTLAIGIIALVAAVVEGVIRGIGAGIIAFLDILLDAMPLVADVAIAYVTALCDVLIGCAPKIIDTVLILILEICEAFVRFVPPIVAAILRLITGVINALASELPDLIQSVVNLLFAFIEGVINALGGMNPEGLLQAFKNMGMLTAIIVMLAAISALTPAAMLGVLAMGAIVTELSIVLAALGALGSIPGLQDLIGEGGNLLQTIGTAIGQFIGGLVGGFVKGATADLPEIASNLSGFAENIGGFLDIAPSLASSMSSLAGASIATAIADFFNFGGSGMDKIKEELPKLGEGLAAFSDALGDRTFSNLSTAADGAKALTDVVNALPRDGGWWGDVFGNKEMGTFGTDLVKLGEGLAGFSDAIGERTFGNVGNAVDAAIALTEIADAIPATGGFVALISGENSITQFSEEIVKLGEGIVGFAETVQDCPDVSPAIAAAKSLVDLTNQIPNEGGVVSWFTGTSAISKYSRELATLGTGIYDFAANVGDADPAKIEAAAKAGMYIAELTNSIPKEEGVAQWFTGTASLSKFGKEMGDLGTGLASFVANAGDIVPDDVKAAAQAAVELAKISEYTPKEGGITGFFAGETNLSAFGEGMGALGTGLSSFAANTTNVTPDTVKAAAEAAVELAKITEYIPNDEGMGSWFKDETSVAKFASEMGDLGTGLNEFATNAGSINPENVKAAASAAVELAKITEYVPNATVFESWFSNKNQMSEFKDSAGHLGTAINNFATNAGTVTPENVKAAAEAVGELAKVTDYVPNASIFASWFGNKNQMTEFKTSLEELGKGIAGFSRELGEDFSLDKVKVGADAAKKLGEMADKIPSTFEMGRIDSFGNKLKTFGTKMKEFIKQTSNITETSTSGANTLITLATKAAEIDSGKIKNLASAIEKLTDAAKDMEKDIKSSMKDAGKKAIEGYINGMNNKLKDAKTAISDIVDKVADKASDKASAFETAGKDCVKGFANGIRNNKYLATDAGSEVGKAALEAAKEAVDSNSPSKEFMRLGRDSDIGFAKGLTRYADMVYDSGYEVGRSGVNGLGESISKISRLVENGIDNQPTIRPVLDLSDIENGAGRIGGLFANTPLGVSANLGAITSMMGSRSHANKDVTDAIKELRNDINKIKTNVYNVNGVTYDDGSNIADAVSTLIRAARIERRV